MNTRNNDASEEKKEEVKPNESTPKEEKNEPVTPAEEGTETEKPVIKKGQLS